jgi:hypothetical protein
MALTDQQIWDMDYKYIPQQQYLLNPFEPGGGTQPEDGIPNTYNYGIPNAYNYGSVNTGDGNDGQTGLKQTWTREREPVIDNSIRVQSLAPANAPPGYYDNSIEGELDYTIDAPPEIFDPKQKTGILQSLKNKFFKPRYKGELGDRLYSQYQTGQKLPSVLAGIAGAQSPFNPESKNYNKNFVDQLNYLEGLDNYIGRDEGSNLLKYGPDSVLSGQNVISGFGSNDYEEQLEKQLEKYKETWKTKSGQWDVAKKERWRKKFLDKATIEMETWDNSPDNPKNKDKPTDEKLAMTGNEEWGDLSDPNNPLYEPPSNDYGFDNSGNFTGEGFGSESTGNESPAADSGGWGDDYASERIAEGGRVGLNLGGLARPFFYGGLARLL